MSGHHRLELADRDAIASAAARRYRAGESWTAIAAGYGLSTEYLRRLTVARHDVTFQRWGQKPIADVDEVRRRRAAGEAITQIA